MIKLHDGGGSGTSLITTTELSYPYLVHKAHRLSTFAQSDINFWVSTNLQF